MKFNSSAVRFGLVSSSLVATFLLVWPGAALQSHEPITSTVTFNQHLLPIFQARCISCHREGGSAFSLETYADARPWAKAIEEEVLRRRMPPWGAVPGFGEFANDPSLTMTEMQRIAEWAEGGAPEGDPVESSTAAVPQPESTGSIPCCPLEVTSTQALQGGVMLQALRISRAPEKSSFKLMAERPDGSQIPLVWITNFTPALRPVYRLRAPVPLSAGTVIRGLPDGGAVQLLVGIGAVVAAR